MQSINGPDIPLHGVALVKLDTPSTPLGPREFYVVCWKGQPFNKRYGSYGDAVKAFNEHHEKLAA